MAVIFKKRNKLMVIENRQPIIYVGEVGYNKPLHFKHASFLKLYNLEVRNALLLKFI